VPVSDTVDALVRQLAFTRLRELALEQGGELHWVDLNAGFTFEGRRVPLVSQQGIFKPAVLDLPLSIRTAPPGDGPPPYQDEHDSGGSISYCYRGTDREHVDNRGLRRCMQLHRPLIWFSGLSKGRYSAYFPAYIVADRPAELRFQVAIDDELFAHDSPLVGQFEGREPIRRYATRKCLQRLHQQEFRARVLDAYGERCCVCRFRHRELLDAAHIVPDGKPMGDPVVPNGLSMCKIHHAAFDQSFLGLRPDGVIEIRADLLREKDGPMLEHGLQRLHGVSATLPIPQRLKPDRERLAWRYEAFQRAS